MTITAQQKIFSASEWEAARASSSSLTPPWDQGVQAVLSAPFELSLVTGAMDAFAVGRYHRLPGAEAAFVAAVEDAQGQVHLCLPVQFEEIVSLLDSLLDFDGPAASLPIDQTLDPAELTVILALADLLKERQLEAALARQPLLPRPVTPGDLVACLEKGRGSQDQRWWMALADLLIPFPLEADAAALEGAMARLVERKVLQAEHLPGPEGGELVGSLLVPLSAACVTFLGGSREAQPLAVDSVVAIRTATCFWTLLFEVAEGQARVRMVAVQAMQLLAHLEELYATYLADFPWPEVEPVPPPAPAPAASAAPLCPHCQSPNHEGAQFCSHCGKSMAPPQVPCPRCQAPMLGGARFCASCGAERPVAESLECPTCHNPLSPGQRFCSHCGGSLDQAPPPPHSCACGRVLAPEAKFCPGCGKPV